MQHHMIQYELFQNLLKSSRLVYNLLSCTTHHCAVDQFCYGSHQMPMDWSHTLSLYVIDIVIMNKFFIYQVYFWSSLFEQTLLNYS